MINTAIIFNHRGTLGKDGRGPIEVRLTVDRDVFYINTGIKVAKKNFVGGTIINQPDSKELNERVRIMYARIQEEVNRCLEDGRKIDAKELRKKIFNFSDLQHGDCNLLIWIEKQEKILQLCEGTLKHYRTLRFRLQEFGKIRRWSDLTVENLFEFDAWLHQLKKPQTETEKMMRKKPECISDGGVYNYHKCLKALLNRAVLMGKIDVNPYNRLRGQFKRGDKESVEFLTAEEMEAVESLHPVEGSQMAIARDIFVFQMHTGLSYADTQIFDISKYYQVDGRWCTIGHRVKTGVEYVIQLSDECERILKKYKWKLPHINNSDYNYCLKALGAAVGIEKRMHTHLARHSFGTYMVAHNIPIQNVKKMMGHKDIKQTLRYAKVLPESVFASFNEVRPKQKQK